jgi:hypothetical protein
METDKQERVSRRAYELWEAAGRPEGDAESFWYQAESGHEGAPPEIGDEAAAANFARDVKARKKSSARAPATMSAVKPVKKARAQ